MDIATRLTLALALIGNLMIPQSLLKYSPCCYDVHGNLTLSCSATPFDSHSHSAAMKERHSCCDPHKIMLRGGAVTQLTSVAVPMPYHDDWQAISPRVETVVQFLNCEITALHIAATDPPASTGLLDRLCRLNL